MSNLACFRNSTYDGSRILNMLVVFGRWMKKKEGFQQFYLINGYFLLPSTFRLLLFLPGVVSFLFDESLLLFVDRAMSLACPACDVKQTSTRAKTLQDCAKSCVAVFATRKVGQMTADFCQKSFLL
jgi:hypothetical protein